MMDTREQLRAGGRRSVNDSVEISVIVPVPQALFLLGVSPEYLCRHYYGELSK